MGKRTEGMTRAEMLIHLLEEANRAQYPGQADRMRDNDVLAWSEHGRRTALLEAYAAMTGCNYAEAVLDAHHWDIHEPVERVSA